MGGKGRHGVLGFLAWFCPDHLYEGIEGDLLEQYDADLAIEGPRIAKLKLALNMLRFFRPGILMRNRFKSDLINTIMLDNYLKVASRNILKRKLYSSINAFGLSVGIACCILLYLYLQDEKSFDQFNVNKDRLYRLESRGYQFWNNQVEERDRYFNSAAMTVGFKQALVDELPEVEFATRLNETSAIVKRGNTLFREDLTLVDPDFFKMFSFRLISGKTDGLLSDPHAVVITPEIAEKFFGKEEPLGKMLSVDFWQQRDYIVTGIIEAPPNNSSINYGILISQLARPNHDAEMSNWGNSNTPTIVQLKHGASAASFDTNINRVALKFMGAKWNEWKADAKLKDDFKLFEFHATPLLQWHTKNDIPWHKVSDPKYGFILGGIAVLILLIACINYISLALMTSASRRIEVGVRKATGAQSNQLLLQFGFESILLAMLSMFLGVILVYLLLPVFNNYTGKSIAPGEINFFGVSVFAIALALLVGLLAGSYPAFIVSRIRPALVLKGRLSSKIPVAFSRPLVVLQFSLSAFLLISAVIMYRQMAYVSTMDLGYDRNDVVVVQTQTGWNEQAEKVVAQFKTHLSSEPEITSVSATSSSFYYDYSNTGYKVNGENKNAYVYTVDPGYVSTLGLTLVQGRNFDERIASDSNAVIVNEALVKDLKWKDPLNEYLNWQSESDSKGAKVIGVVKNYNNQSVESAIQPLLLSIDTRSRHLVNVLVKLNPSARAAGLQKLESSWKSIYPDKIFEYTFLDQDVAKHYQSHQRWLDIMGIATLFAILISCLGLFGMSGVNALNRTKEIGIRKVMGAGMKALFVLLNREYIMLWLISFAIAVPFSVYVMKDWLSGFTYRIEMGLPLFAMSLLSGLLISLATVSYHTIRVSRLNPADTLKNE